MTAAAIDAIDACLPQTQCRQCGYAGCRPYAAALADGTAELNRCPPGGDATIALLAQLLQRSPLPLDATCGSARPRQVAFIEEDICIGCALCLKACPVDAIVGARRQMHTVVSTACTGCALCVPPCPVDCIRLPLAPARAGARWRDYPETDVTAARQAFHARNARLAAKTRTQDPALPKLNRNRAKAEIAAAVARKRAQTATPKARD